MCAYMARFQESYWSINLLLAFLGSGIAINTMVLIMHDSVILYEHKLYADLEVERLWTANAEARNLLLKQKINPHFLFNALNTLKALYNKDTAIADDYIVHMASFLRTSIHHQSSNLAPLAQELAFLNDYEVTLNKAGSALPTRQFFDLERDNRITALQAYKLFSGNLFERDIYTKSENSEGSEKKKVWFKLDLMSKMPMGIIP